MCFFKAHLSKLSVLHRQCFVLVVQSVMAVMAKSYDQSVLIAVRSVLSEDAVMIFLTMTTALYTDMPVIWHYAFHAASGSQIDFILASSSGVSVSIPSSCASETIPSMKSDISFVSYLDDPT